MQPNKQEIRRALAEVNSKLEDKKVFYESFKPYFEMLEVAKWSLEMDLKRLELFDDDGK